MDVGAIESPYVQGMGPDFDDDGDVDGADFLAWQRGLSKVAATKSDGDANIDGQVDATDLSIWEEAYGTSSTGVEAIAAGFQASEPLLAPVVYEVATVTEVPMIGFVAGLSLEVATEESESVETDENGEFLVQDEALSSLTGVESAVQDTAVFVLAETSSGEELELSVADEVFDLLGS